MAKNVVKIVKAIIDGEEWEIAIETPKDWECSVEGCKSKVKHTHSNFRVVPA